MSPSDLNNKAETVERFILDLVKAFREKQWVRILSLLGVVSVLLLNPPAVEFGLQRLNVNLPSWYSYLVWLILVVVLFISAFLVALLRKKRHETAAVPPRSIIKGLLPYTNTKEDSEWFAKLQRGNILHEVMGFCCAADSSFGVLCGESGAGKTSLLQAAVLPELERQGYHAVYIKVTEDPPLNTISRALLAEGEELPHQSLLELLHQTTRHARRPVVLILDQFEQFFAHNKTKVSRRNFIQEMADWYANRNSLSVSVLVSIRSDFASRMNEFQHEMGYTLTPHSSLSIEKFEPQEAALVIGVIADEVKLKLDEGFVMKFAEQELAQRDDGLVSPVDIQILSWMVVGQKRVEERAFNQRAFQRIGGVEGLLGKFLRRALGSIKADPRLQQAVTEVMLALADGNVRAGAMSYNSLREKLKKTIHDKDIERALDWLVSSDVRLVTAIQDKKATHYELAHDHLIPPLRRLASKDVKGLIKAREILDRRVNEWLGNDRSRRYLLTFSEWITITRHWDLIEHGAQQKQKEELVALSRRRFLTLAITATTTVVLGTTGYKLYQWHEEKLDVQMDRAQRRLLKLLEENNDVKAIQDAAMLILALGDDELDKQVSEQLWKALSKLETNYQAEVLDKLAQAYRRLGTSAAELKRLTELGQKMESLDPDDQAHVWLSLSAAYKKFGEIKPTLNGLTRIQQAIPGLEMFMQAHIFQLMAEAYGNLGNDSEALKGLQWIHAQTERFDSYYRGIVWLSLAPAYHKVGDSSGVLDELDKVRQGTAGMEPNMQSTVLGMLAQTYGSLPHSAEVLNGLAVIRQDGKKFETYYRAHFLVTLTESYANFKRSHEILADLAEVREHVKKLSRINQASVLAALADAYGRAEKNEEVLHGLSEIRTETEKLDLSTQLSVFEMLAMAYSRLGDSSGELDGLTAIHHSAQRLDPRNQAQVLSYVINAYKEMGHSQGVLDGLHSIHQTTEKLEPNIQVYALHALSDAYAKAENINEEMRIFEKLLLMEKDMAPHIKTQVLIDMASHYARLEKWRQSLDVIELFDGIDVAYGLSRVWLIWRDKKNGTTYRKILEEVFESTPTRNEPTQ